MFLEESAECRWIRKIQQVGYLFYAFVGVVYQEDALPDDGLEHVLLYCHARHAFHYRRKVFWRKA